jgi:hypothetical protein
MSSDSPEFKVLSVETTVTGTAFEGYDFVKKCATEYSLVAKDKDLPTLVNYLIFQLEEEEILTLKNTESTSYQTLKATLTPILERLHCNIVVVIGHTETCFSYIEKTGLPTLNALPTIVLVVACFSESRIGYYNTQPEMIEKNFFFFGFQNLMHLLQGEILACKSPHLATPFLDCRFEEVKEDLKVLQENLSEYNKPYANQVDLLKCCKGRYEHFKQVFYEYLSKRECVKFPTENLFEKLKTIRKEDGSLFRNVSMVGSSATISSGQLKTYIFSRSEGVPCTDEGNCSTGKTNYTTYKANLTKFDDRVKYGNEATKKLFAILDQTSRYTPEEHSQKDKEMMDVLKALPKAKALATLTHAALYRNEDAGISYHVPLFFFIFAENYKLSQQEILKNHDVPLDILLKNKYTLLLVILEHLSRRYSKPTLTEVEVYRLIKAIGRKNPKAIEVAFQTNSAITFLFNNKTCYLSLIELLFRYFPNAAPNAVWGYISKVNEHVEDKNWTLIQASKVLELFASFGKFYEATGLDTISFITAYETSMTSATTKSYKLQLEFVLLIYIYLQDTNKFPDTTLENKLSDLSLKLASTKDYMKPKMNRLIKVYKAANDFFMKGGIPMTSYRKTPELMNLLMDADLEPFEASTAAIDNVKTYFSSVQPNIQKRKDLNTATKTAAIQELVSLYKGVNSLKNEGENSLRRLQEMHRFYSQFLKNHPRENKKLPTVKILEATKKTDTLWLYEIVGIILFSLKAPKVKTVRRSKLATVANSATLQHELNNIKTRLNAHNSGTSKLHHMTVKSLRKKKNQVEQKLRNLAPPTNTAANNRGNNRENNEGNNQAGGRRTRKLRR